MCIRGIILFVKLCYKIELLPALRYIKVTHSWIIGNTKISTNMVAAANFSRYATQYTFYLVFDMGLYILLQYVCLSYESVSYKLCNMCVI